MIFFLKNLDKKYRLFTISQNTINLFNIITDFKKIFLMANIILDWTIMWLLIITNPNTLLNKFIILIKVINSWGEKG